MRSLIGKYLIALFLIGLVLDYITKNFIKTNFYYGELKPVINGFFNIVYILNPGAAFGIFRRMHSDYRQIFLISITILAIIVILILLIKENKRIPALGYTLVLTGACGNLIDRATMGKVVDFLDFYIKSYHWPAFNVADICVTVGIGFLIIDAIFFPKKVFTKK